MKRLILSGALACAVLSASAEAQAPDNAKQQVKQLLRDWAEAENRHDAAALERILDDQFISTSGFGKPHSKADFIKALTSGKPDPRQSQTLEDESVVVEGDTAVDVGTNIFHMSDKSAPDGMALRYTITFVRRDGHWRALAEHIVKITK
ncbi:MAG TPA: nuclear transport factor 2 family protein [Rhizomicrobium sp.]|nr:nuclear transport factor 2 family protein [Rhizomicrobium sp.]